MWSLCSCQSKDYMSRLQAEVGVCNLATVAISLLLCLGMCHRLVDLYTWGKNIMKNSQLPQAGTPAQLLGMIRKQFDENWCTCFSFIEVKTFKTPIGWKVLLWQQLLANRNWKLRNSWSSQGKAMLKIWWKSMNRFRL